MTCSSQTQNRIFFRDNDTYVLQKYSTKTFGYHSMAYIGAKLWGKINSKVKKLKCIKSFKKEIKTLLIGTSIQSTIADYF